MKAEIIIKGGRGSIEDGAHPSRGQDIGVYVVRDGKRILLPVTSLVLTVRDRKAVATVTLDVDAVEVDGIEIERLRRDAGLT